MRLDRATSMAIMNRLEAKGYIEVAQLIELLTRIHE